MRDSPSHPAFTFYGSAEKIAEDKALVSAFRKANGMNPDPLAPLIGTRESIDQQLAMLSAFKKRL